MHLALIPLTILSLLCQRPTFVAGQTGATTAVPMATTTAASIGGFTSEQLGVLIGIPVALVIIILVGIVIGCVVQHKVKQEDKLLEGKPYGEDRAGAGGKYYTDYLSSQTKSQ